MARIPVLLSSFSAGPEVDVAESDLDRIVRHEGLWHGLGQGLVSNHNHYEFDHGGTEKKHR